MCSNGGTDIDVYCNTVAIREENINLIKTDGSGMMTTVNVAIINGSAMANFATTTDTSPLTTELPSPMDMDQSIHVSKYLWYMLVSGYILPICGILTFFIVTYYWVQEFPIGICVDVMSCVLDTPGIDDLTKINQPDEEELKKKSKIKKFIHFAELKKQFRGFRNTAWYSKFAYPFQSPQTVLLSIIYAILQGVFVIFAFKTIGVLSIPWFLFCCAAGFIGFIANLYVFAIAIFGIVVSMFLLTFFLSSFVCLCFVCMLVYKGTRSNYQYQRQY